LYFCIYILFTELTFFFFFFFFSCTCAYSFLLSGFALSRAPFYVIDKKVIKSFGLKTSDIAVKVITDGIQNIQLASPFTEDDLDAFVRDNSLPLLSELTGSNFQRIVSGEKLVVMAVTDPEDDRTPLFVDAMKTVARSYRSKFVFANLDGVKFARYVSNFGVTPESVPMCFVFDYGNEKFYPPTADYPIDTVDNVHRFLDAVFDGTLSPHTVGAWWNPVRLFKWFEKWLGQFTDTQLIIGSVTVGVGLIGAVLFLCCSGLDESRPEIAAIKKNAELAALRKDADEANAAEAEAEAQAAHANATDATEANSSPSKDSSDSDDGEVTKQRSTSRSRRPRRA
jgi:Thioredoxin-like domain